MTVYTSYLTIDSTSPTYVKENNGNLGPGYYSGGTFNGTNWYAYVEDMVAYFVFQGDLYIPNSTTVTIEGEYPADFMVGNNAIIGQGVTINASAVGTTAGPGGGGSGTQGTPGSPRKAGSGADPGRPGRVGRAEESAGATSELQHSIPAKLAIPVRPLRAELPGQPGGVGGTGGTGGPGVNGGAGGTAGQGGHAGHAGIDGSVKYSSYFGYFKSVLWPGRSRRYRWPGWQPGCSWHRHRIPRRRGGEGASGGVGGTGIWRRWRKE